MSKMVQLGRMELDINSLKSAFVMKDRIKYHFTGGTYYHDFDRHPIKDGKQMIMDMSMIMDIDGDGNPVILSSYEINDITDFFESIQQYNEKFTFMSIGV
jgi:hypothetical protein